MKKGFTLIEVMISMLIMSMLTVLVSSSIRSAVQNKKKLEARIAMETSLFDALRVIKQDVERAFNYQDVFFEIERLAIQNLQAAKSNPGGASGGSGAPGGAAPVAPPANNPNSSIQARQPALKLTHFIGTADTMHFTTLNHFRTKYNAQESNQMEVGYFVDNCQKRDGSGSTDCLWRRSNTEIDDKVDEDGAKVVVVEDVKKFSLEYRNKQEDAQWVKEWRSDNRGRADHRNKFPEFVKVSLELETQQGRNKKNMKQTMVVRLQFSNNEPILDQQVNTGGRPPQ